MPTPIVGRSPSGPRAWPMVTKPTFWSDIWNPHPLLALEGGVEGDVARGEVDPADELTRLGGPLGAVVVVGDLGRVDFEGEPDVLPGELVEDRAPLLGEVLVAGVDLGRLLGREREPEVPDRGAGEAGHDVDAEVPGRAGG